MYTCTCVSTGGDHFLLQMKDMLAETCACRHVCACPHFRPYILTPPHTPSLPSVQVPDCDLFLNKRDYPQLKFNSALGVPVEPYGYSITS